MSELTYRGHAPLVGSKVTFSEGFQFVKKFVYIGTAVLPASKALFSWLTVFFLKDSMGIGVTAKCNIPSLHAHFWPEEAYYHILGQVRMTESGD